MPARWISLTLLYRDGREALERSRRMLRVSRQVLVMSDAAADTRIFARFDPARLQELEILKEQELAMSTLEETLEPKRDADGPEHETQWLGRSEAR